MWKPVNLEEYSELYDVSTEGEVRRRATQRILKARSVARPGGFKEPSCGAEPAI